MSITISITAAILAVIFFANPYISTLDLLPDAVGCLLMWYSLRRAEAFSPKLEEARRRWLRLAAITGLDFIVSYVTPTRDGTMILLVVFVFRIAEAFLMYNAAAETFDGVVYLGTKFEGDGIYMHDSKRKQERRSRKENAERARLDRMLDHERERYERETADGIDEEHRHRATVRYSRAVAKLSADAGRVRHDRDGIAALSRLTLVFLIVRAAACVLPEFTALSSYQHLGDVPAEGAFDITRFRPMFISLGFIVAAVFAICWLIRMLIYIGGIRRDRRFLSAVRDEFETFATENSNKYLSRRLSAALTFLIIGVVCTLDIVVDNINYVPDFIAAVFFAGFFIILLKDLEKAKRGLIICAAWGAAAVAQWLTVYAYVDKFHDFTRTVNSSEAFGFYVVCCVVTAVTEALFILLAVTIFGELKKIIASHTGSLTEEEEEAGGSSARRTTYIRQELSKMNSRARFLAYAASVAALAYMIIVGINKQITVENEIMEYVRYVPVFPAINIVSVAVTLLFIVYTVKYISDLADNVKERYRLL